MQSQWKNKADGWYVDHCIRKILMPDMEAGEHELIVEIPYNSKVNIEAMFLLGEFSVKSCGKRPDTWRSEPQSSFQ